jgi:hypothetical protein
MVSSIEVTEFPGDYEEKHRQVDEFLFFIYICNMVGCNEERPILGDLF